MGTLGIGNGAIDFRTQVPYFPEFANFNTYGIKTLNKTQYNFAKFSCFWESGCLAAIDGCRALNHTTHADFVLCAQSASLCTQTVESVYYTYSGRGTYDIRANSSDTGGPMFFTQYMNKPEVQNALGVDLNYTDSNVDVQVAFIATGDLIYRNAIDDLSFLLDSGVRVTLYYGDADYICNWFGGQAVSLAVNHTQSKEFANANYQLMTVDNKVYGEVREYGNFSFFRIFEAGHTVSLALVIQQLLLCFSLEAIADIRLLMTLRRSPFINQ
jgi:carboxypeptidase C (cathepsin A)